MWPPDPIENQYYLLVSTSEASYESCAKKTWWKFRGNYFHMLKHSIITACQWVWHLDKVVDHFQLTKAATNEN